MDRTLDHSGGAAARRARGCAPRATTPTPARAVVALASAESTFALARDARDRYDVTVASGRSAAEDGATLDQLAARANETRDRLDRVLAAVDSSALAGADVRALTEMRRVALRDLLAITATNAGAAVVPSTGPDCSADTTGGIDSLRARIYACYGWAQSHVPFGADTLDRLTILGTIGSTDDVARRRALFLALAPVWRSMNGGNEPDSPYRRLIAMEASARPDANPRLRPRLGRRVSRRTRWSRGSWPCSAPGATRRPTRWSSRGIGSTRMGAPAGS